VELRKSKPSTPERKKSEARFDPNGRLISEKIPKKK
jgi:hypothetical protein